MFDYLKNFLFYFGVLNENYKLMIRKNFASDKSFFCDYKKFLFSFFQHYNHVIATEKYEFLCEILSTIIFLRL